MGPVAAGRAGGRAVGWPTPGTGPALVPAPPPARARRRRAPAPRAGLRRAERRTDLREEGGSGGGTDLRVRRGAGSARLGPRIPLPGLSALAWGRPRKIYGRPLKGGGEVTRRGGGRRDRGFPSPARGTALPCAPRASCVPVSVLGAGPQFLQYCGIRVPSGRY